MTTPSGPDDPLEEALDALGDRYGSVALGDRTFVLRSPVHGDAGFAVLQMLALAQGAHPVGAAAHGPGAVAIGVWRPPDLYVVKWTQNRWIAGYRLPRGSKPADYIRSEGRIPSRLESGNWYADVPDEVSDAFHEVGLLVEAPPFTPPEVLPPPEPKRRAAAAAAKAPARRAAAAPAPKRTPAPRSRPQEEPKPPPPPTDRVCPSCNMRRSVTQFTPGSDLCVDCR